MTRLEALDVAAFRGIANSSLQFEGGSIVLGGGNGTGKSAFVDALEFLYTGAISTLSGVGGLSLRQHGPHIQHKGEAARVTASYDDPPLRITRRISGGLDVPAALETHLQTGGRLPFILRRAQLQQFIHATPANRYRSMADLLGADTLERSELAMKRAADSIERDLHGLEARRAEIDAVLLTVSGDGQDSTETLLSGANDALAALGFNAVRISTVADLAAARGAILERLAPPKPDPRREARLRAADALSRGIEEPHLRDSIDVYVAAVEAGTDLKIASQALDLLQVLRRGREYVLATAGRRCPLCEQPVEAHTLARQIGERITMLEEASLLQRKVDEARDELDSALRETTARTQGVLGLLSAAGIDPPSTPLDTLAMLAASVRSSAVAESVAMARRLDRALERWEQWSGETAVMLRGDDTVPATDDGAAEVEAALAVLEKVGMGHAAAERSRQEAATLREERARLERAVRQKQQMLELATTAYSSFNRVKNREIQAVYDELRTDLATFYDFLHPGEGHGVVGLSMDPRKRGSSELAVGFYGREGQDPRAFSSEGHLDSLGLCIFLAFANRMSAGWPLLVLDDVVTSVDAAHKGRVADLLFQHFGDRQLFITTHDARWFLDLKRAQREVGTGSAQNLIIESWSLDRGPGLRADAS